MKRTAIALTLILTSMILVAGSLFANTSSANFFPNPGPDLPRIYVRNDGSVEPTTAPIERTDNLYKLTDNIYLYTIDIQCDNIVLDGAGYSIEGNSSWLGTERYAENNGIIIAGQNNVNLTNLNIESFTTGVRISDSSLINIVGNNFTDLVAVMGTPMGIVIDASSNVLIEKNNFNKINGPAIACNGTNNTIRRNILTDGSISIEGSSNTITDNQIETTYSTIRLGLAYSNIIARNTITGDISLVSCSNNRISENNLTKVRIVFGSNNTFYGNYIANKQCTVDLTVTSNNTFYGNTFAANCSVRLYDAGATFWDNGTIGNYWSDYNGTDGNGDGIGDSPYMITGVKWDNDVGGDVSFVAGQDNYPLMAPFEDTQASTPSPESQVDSGPFPTAFAVGVSGASAAVISLGLLAYFKNRKG